MNTLNDIIAMEATVAPMVQKAKDELVAQIRATPVPGVKPLGHESIRCFTIQASTLASGRSWSAEFWCANSQADIVEKALSKVSTATALKKRLAEMLEKKAVKDSAGSHTLNDTTLGIISRAIG